MMDRHLSRIYSKNKADIKISAQSLNMHCYLLRPLCNIVVDISPLLVPFHVILLNQSILVSTVSHSHLGTDILLNVLLNVRRIQYAPGLCSRNDFTDQLRVRDGLSALHDPNNGRLRLIIAIRSDTLVCLLILLLGLFGLDLIDLDAIPRVGEVEIESKHVCVVDVFTFWLFVEDAVLGAGKGLERPLEFRVV